MYLAMTTPIEATHPVLYLHVPDRNLHAAFVGQCHCHGLRCHRPGSPLDRTGCGILHRKRRRGFCSDPHRSHHHIHGRLKPRHPASICTMAWVLCFFFYLGAIFTIDKDAHDLRSSNGGTRKSHVKARWGTATPCPYHPCKLSRSISTTKGRWRISSICLFLFIADIPQWVPPLQMDERIRLSPKRFPFYKHSHASFFIAYERSSPVNQPRHWSPRCFGQPSLQRIQQRIHSLLLSL